jgi:hypothetical protein
MNESHPDDGGAIERMRTMTGHSQFTSDSYVAAYQAEVRADMRSARVGHSVLGARRQRSATWLSKLWARITGNHRQSVVSARMRSFDRSSATGACEISDGLAV